MGATPCLPKCKWRTRFLAPSGGTSSSVSSSVSCDFCLCSDSINSAFSCAEQSSSLSSTEFPSRRIRLTTPAPPPAPLSTSSLSGGRGLQETFLKFETLMLRKIVFIEDISIPIISLGSAAQWALSLALVLIWS